MAARDPLVDSPSLLLMSREGRIALLDDVFAALRDGRMPGPTQAAFASTGWIEWRARGGNLTRDYWAIQRRYLAREG